MLISEHQTSKIDYQVNGDDPTALRAHTICIEKPGNYSYHGIKTLAKDLCEHGLWSGIGENYLYGQETAGFILTGTG